MTYRVRKEFVIPHAGKTLPSASVIFHPLESIHLPALKQTVLFCKVEPKQGKEYTLIVGYKIRGREKYEPEDHPGTWAIEVFLPTEEEKRHLADYFFRKFQRPVQFYK
jgi:hypothetical protein